MAVSGTLAIKVHRLEATFMDNDLQDKKYAVRVALADEDVRTKYKAHDEQVDQTVELPVSNSDENAPVTIEVCQEGRKKAMVSAKLSLADFFKGFTERKMTFTFGTKAAPNTVLLYFSGEWNGASSGAIMSSSTVSTLSATPTHRPWFTRVSYYYDTSKNVYNYTTSFRVVAPFARFYENTANLVLEKVTGKTLRDVDSSLLVPVLDTVDSKVDVTISTVLTKLFEGQQYALKTKDAAVEKASGLASATKTKVSNAASATYSGAVSAKDYTTSTVSNAASAVVSTASSVTDYATTQVVNVSSSTYGTVKNASWYVVSHIPILGSKIGA